MRKTSPTGGRWTGWKERRDPQQFAFFCFRFSTMMGKPILVTLWLSLALLFQHKADAQCNPDKQAPAITCPQPATLTSSTYPLKLPEAKVVATDNCDGNPTIVQSPAAGTLLRQGMYNVDVTATDNAGNKGKCTWRVSVSRLFKVVKSKRKLPKGSASFTATYKAIEDGVLYSMVLNLTKPLDVGSVEAVLSDSFSTTYAPVKITAGTGVSDLPVTFGRPIDFVKGQGFTLKLISLGLNEKNRARVTIYGQAKLAPQS